MVNVNPVAKSTRTTVILLGLLVVIAGCQTRPQFADLNAENPVKSDPIVLREGDSVKISFPGAPNLNSVQQIKRDGRISLQLIGEVQAAGLTANALEKELIKQYGPQLQTKEVTVAIETSNFPIYVTGAVLRPGKLMSDRPITALEAILESGGPDYSKAKLTAVRVIRRENGGIKHYKLDMKRVLQGDDTEQFQLKPSDILYVPERFVWF